MLNKFLPIQFFMTLKSYLESRIRVNIEKISKFTQEFHKEVTSAKDIPMLENSTLATVADDAAILNRNRIPVPVTHFKQKFVNMFQKLFEKWKIHLNESKSAHGTLSLS